MNQGRLVGLITTWLEDLRDRKPSETGQCWGKHFWKNLNERRKWQVLFQPEPIHRSVDKSMLSLLRITIIVENWWYRWIKTRMKMFFCLRPPSKIHVLDLTELQEKICVFKTWDVFAVQPGVYWATASMHLRFLLRQFHCFYSFWVHGGKEAPQIQEPMGIHCKGVLRDLWPQLQQTVIKPSKVWKEPQNLVWESLFIRMRKTSKL